MAKTTILRGVTEEVEMSRTSARQWLMGISTLFAVFIGELWSGVSAELAVYESGDD